jgi:hypothetical protein
VDPTGKITEVKRAGSIAQVVECLPSQVKDLSTAHTHTHTHTHTHARNEVLKEVYGARHSSSGLSS